MVIVACVVAAGLVAAGVYNHDPRFSGIGLVIVTITGTLWIRGLIRQIGDLMTTNQSLQAQVQDHAAALARALAERAATLEAVESIRIEAEGLDDA